MPITSAARRGRPATTSLVGSEVRRKNGAAIRRTLGPYYLVGVVLALAIPESFAASFPPTRWLGAVVPGIAHLVVLSSSPEAMRLFLSVMWLLLPFAAYHLALAWHWNPRIFELKRSDQWFVVAFAALIAMLLFAFLFFFVELDPSHRASAGGRRGALIRLMIEYRLGMALIGPLLFCILAATAGLAVRLAYLVARSGARAVER
jgi:hypothetical protein